MCSLLDPMARYGTPYYNLNPRGSSPFFFEPGLGRQMEPHNGGAIATTGAWQVWQEAGASIDGLRGQVSRILQRWRKGDDCGGEWHSFSFALDEARRRVDRVHNDYVRTESSKDGCNNVLSLLKIDINLRIISHSLHNLNLGRKYVRPFEGPEHMTCRKCTGP